ncbi:MAG: efflux transporter outer membrane subunit, partial [Desulfobacterales bacterium]
MKSNRMGKWLPLLTALLMLLVSGCATLGPDFRPPEVETPAAYRSALPGEGVEFNLKWWNLFQDPDLYQIVTQALANNRDLGVAASRIVEARAALGFTEADRLPRIDLDVGAMTGNYSGGSRSPDTNSTAFIAPTINWEIDFWGKFSRANEAARADLMASQYALDTVQLTLISEVVSAYYQLLDFQQREVIARETLDSRLESLDIIQQRFDQGTVPEIDLNQAQIQKEIAAGAIPLYQRSIAKVENALSILMGRLPGGIRTGSALTQQPIPPDIPMGLPADLLTRRPDIAQAFYQLKAQTARIGVAEALRFPSISLTGVLGLASSELSSITSEGEVWSLGGGLVAPLLDFGKNRRR